MGNLMILPAVEPKRISWLNEYATDAEVITDIPQREKKTLPFIEANTKAVELSHLKNECIVPVFSKDNELTISHPAFIETVAEAVSTFSTVKQSKRLKSVCRTSLRGESPKRYTSLQISSWNRTKRFITSE